MIKVPKEGLTLQICRETNIVGSLVRGLRVGEYCTFKRGTDMCGIWESEGGGNRKPCDAKEYVLKPKGES